MRWWRRQRARHLVGAWPSQRNHNVVLGVDNLGHVLHLHPQPGQKWRLGSDIACDGSVMDCRVTEIDLP